MKNDSTSTPPRILCISPLFAPAASAEAFCSAKMVQALRQSGASVTVLCSSNLYGGSREDASHMWESMRGVAVDVPQPVGRNPVHSITAAVQFQTLSYARWIDAVVKKAQQLHEKNKFDLVYSRSMPMAAHVAGYWAARKLKLPWIANINDPWEFNFWPEVPKGSPVRTQECLGWLRRTLRKADLVTYPCEGLHRFHAKLAKLDHAAQILPHIGYKPERPGPAPDGQFRLIHAGMLGSWDQSGRSPEAMLLGLKAFLDSSAEARARTKLVLVGPEDKETQSRICKLGLEQNVESVGRVSYEDSLTHIASASVCVLIEARMNEGIFFPSKLADYVACGKPVLALSPQVGTAADLASRGELIRVDHDPEAVRVALASLYSEFERGSLSSRSPSERQIREFQPHSVAEQFLTASRTLMARGQSESLQSDPKESWTRVRHSDDLSRP